MKENNPESEGSKTIRVVPWIYLLDNNGRIVNQVKVTWPSIRKAYLAAKEKERQKIT